MNSIAVPSEVLSPRPNLSYEALLNRGIDLDRPSSEINNRRIVDMKILRSPEEMVGEFPVDQFQTELVHKTRVEIENVLDGRDNRLVVVVGPCSIHNYEAALEYAKFMTRMQVKFQDSLVLVMRTYFSKPRTTVGWKGYIYDPELNGSFQINNGLELARKLLLDILAMGVPCSMEHLDTITPQYFGDLLSWAAIGARTTESQIHRELASGISSPIGFKNGTGGSIKLAVNAVAAAAQPHHFLGCNSVGQITSVETSGNPYCHLIMRGSDQGPNYEAEHLKVAAELLQEGEVSSNIFVDFSHGNSQKQYFRQLVVSESVSTQIAGGNNNIKGVMIESNLVEGAQKITNHPLVYGKSITDSCVNPVDTEKILVELSNAVKLRQATLA